MKLIFRVIFGLLSAALFIYSLLELKNAAYNNAAFLSVSMMFMGLFGIAEALRKE